VVVLKGQGSPTAMALMAFRNREVSRLVDADGDEMLMEKENWSELVALTNISLWSCRESNPAQKSR
jgi:hypothetical protein